MKLKEKLLSLLVRWLGFGLRARLPQVTPSPVISQDISPDGNAVSSKVSLLALGKMAAIQGQSFNALPQLPLGVIPPQLLAQDGQTHASLAIAQDNAAFCHAFLTGAVQGTGFKGYAALAELSQLSEYRSPTETLATEMTRQWISFKSTGAYNRSEQLQAIEAAFDQFKIRDKLKQAVEHDGFFGRGMLYIDMGMPELNDTPLIINKATIRQNSVQGFKVIEPVWTSPANYNATDPTAKDFYQPHSWYVMGRQIHTSRLITLIARPLPDMLKPAYNFSGLSMTQLLEPAVNAWLRTRDSVSELVHSFSTSGVKTDMQAVLSGGNGDDILHRAQLFNQMRDNRGLMLLDKDNEEFFQFHTPLGGMESLQAQAQEQMAAPCHIPLVKLFGITPHGLNASSEGEIKVFYDYIQAMQQTLLTDPLVKILQIIQLHLFGEIYDDITFEYCPLEQMNEQQEVSISKAKVEIGSALLQAGVISKEEERQRLAADPLSGYDGLGDGLSNQLPEQEQAGQSGVPGGMQAMDEAQCDWREYLHPRDKKGQFTCKGQGVPLKYVPPKYVEGEQTALQVTVGGGGKYGNTASTTQLASKIAIAPEQTGVTTAKQSIEKANVKKSTSVLPRESNYGVAVHAGESVREGVDPYQIYNTGSQKGSRIAHEDLSVYTVNDLVASAKNYKNTDLRKHFANGRYQMVPDMLQSAIKAKVITGNEKFTPQLQEHLFINYIAKIKRPAIYEYLTGKSDSLDEALMQNSKEFASAGVPYDFVRKDAIYATVNGKKKQVGTDYVPIKKGESYYKKAGSSNKANHSAEFYAEAMQKDRQTITGLIKAGYNAETAYQYVMGGIEKLPALAGK